jgi:hypothetical protein
MKMSYDGRHRSDHVDVFTGPAVPLAVDHAKSVDAGKLRLTSFTAWDTGELMGLDGRSLIVRLPHASAENNRPYQGIQWFLDGSPVGPIEYSPDYVDCYVETTKCWLLDLAVLNNWFAEQPDRQAVLFSRHKSLDTGHGGMQRMKLHPPDGYQDDENHMFTFDVPHDLDVEVGADLPVGIWYAHVKESKVLPGILERAQSAPFACVIYLRLQKDHPRKSKNDRTKQSTSTPE